VKASQDAAIVGRFIEGPSPSLVWMGCLVGRAWLPVAASTNEGYAALCALAAPHTVVEHRSYAQWSDEGGYCVSFVLRKADEPTLHP